MRLSHPRILLELLDALFHLPPEGRVCQPA
jgi:hypothetical protein